MEPYPKLAISSAIGYGGREGEERLCTRRRSPSRILLILHLGGGELVYT